MLVVDVAKVDRNRSQVDMYAPRFGYEHLTEATLVQFKPPGTGGA